MKQGIYPSYGYPSRLCKPLLCLTVKIDFLYNLSFGRLFHIRNGAADNGSQVLLIAFFYYFPLCIILRGEKPGEGSIVVAVKGYIDGNRMKRRVSLAGTDSDYTTHMTP